MRFMLICCLFATGLTAQVDSLTTFELGFGGGQYFNNVNFTLNQRAANEYLPYAAPNIGLGLRYFANRAIGFAAELNYNGGGWQETIDSLSLNYERQLSYLEGQIFTQLAIGRKRIRPLIQAGPYLSVPIGDKEIAPAGFVLPEDDTYFNRPLDFRLNYGLVFGAGLYVKLGPVAIQAEGRFQAGLSDIIKSGTNGVTTSRRQAVGWRIMAWYQLAGE